MSNMVDRALVAQTLRRELAKCIKKDAEGKQNSLVRLDEFKLRNISHFAPTGAAPSQRDLVNVHLWEHLENCVEHSVLRAIDEAVEVAVEALVEDGLAKLGGRIATNTYPAESVWLLLTRKGIAEMTNPVAENTGGQSATEEADRSTLADDSIPARELAPQSPATSGAVFVSYTHEDADHKSWVLRFATDLRERGVDVQLDRWDLSLGADVTLFMERGVRDSQRVLLIFTPTYCKKAEAREGGVGYENLVITAALQEQADTTKFIGVLRRGAHATAVPAFLKSRLYVDMSDDDLYSNGLEELLRALHGVPAYPRPPVGPNPFAGRASPPTVTGGLTTAAAPVDDRSSNAVAVAKGKVAHNGPIDVAIITIKPEEEDAVLQHFPRKTSVSGERDYGITYVTNTAGKQLVVASVRLPEQGNIAATAVTKDVIADLRPRWILLVGIAGASPFNDAVLGDIVFGTQVQDLTVRVENPNGEENYSAAGGRATGLVKNKVTHLRPELQRDVEFPPPPDTLDLTKLDYTTADAELNGKIEGRLRQRFGTAYKNRIFDGSIISTDALVKDPDLLKDWVKLLRNTLAVEMEAAGAHNAASGRETHNLLVIRGISDIVGLRKIESWVGYACNVAAVAAFEFVRRLDALPNPS